MKLIKIKLSDLVVPEKNIRIHTEKQINEFVRSLNMFGQIRPVVVDENNVILAGNGLVEALKKANYETADAYKICNLTENQKKKLMIADNKIFSLGIENLDTLNEFIDDLKDDLTIPGFDDDILASMVENAVETTERIAGYGILDSNEIEQIKNTEEKQEVKKEISADESVEPEPEKEETKTESTENSDIEQDENFIICPKCGEKIWL